ncbi:MAG: hypothetical protein RL609_1332 [Bacteroidota bacterium]|jgi:hypothetical protein
MKKTSFFLVALGAILMLTTMSSCNKDTSGKVTFWYGQGVALYASTVGATSFTFYLNNEVIGSSAADVYSVNTPDCGDGGAVTESVDLEGDDSASISYKVVDQDGTTWWEGSVKIEDGGCLNQQLTL